MGSQKEIRRADEPLVEEAEEQERKVYTTEEIEELLSEIDQMLEEVDPDFDPSEPNIWGIKQSHKVKGFNLNPQNPVSEWIPGEEVMKRKMTTRPKAERLARQLTEGSKEAADFKSSESFGEALDRILSETLGEGK
jgi:hypothetical protein